MVTAGPTATAERMNMIGMLGLNQIGRALTMP